MSIEIRNLRKTFGEFDVLKDLSLTVESGELLALLGPSGCGKTTLLRIIAGLETADAGQVLFHGEDATQRPVSERQVGFVFQHYALFRHMSVFDNVAFGLSVRPRASRPAKADIRERVMRLLKLVQLDWLADAYRISSPAASASALPWRARWRWSRACCCWTSRLARWTPRCARTCAAGCASCTTTSTSPACLSPTTRKKRWKSLTAWW